jgi:hypothetical protein
MIASENATTANGIRKRNIPPWGARPNNAPATTNSISDTDI